MKSDKLIYAPTELVNSKVGTKYEALEEDTLSLIVNINKLKISVRDTLLRMYDNDTSCIEDDYYAMKRDLHSLIKDVEDAIQNVPV